MNVRFHPVAAGVRSGTITVHDVDGNRPDVVLNVRGMGQALPGVGQACGANSRCAAGSTCENHSNGTSRVCCGADCTGNQFCSQSQNFNACELPTVVGGARCLDGTNVCQAGFTCNDATRPGFCCRNNCSGACDTCAASGECVAVAPGSAGRCPAGRVCGDTRQCGCAAGTKDCNGQCILTAACCGGCPVGTACQNGTCVDPRVGTGRACSADGDCLSGNCNDFNVCCESACNGTCQACGNDGRCDDTPATDNRCAVTCAASNTCRTSTPPQAGTCGGFGLCAQCTTVNARAGGLCNPGQICDGSGTCGEDTSGLVAAGPLHTCAVTSTGAVRCWGYNEAAALGYGHTTNIGDGETPAQAATTGLGGNLAFGNGRRAVQVTAGTGHSCALFDNGTVRCWTRNPAVAGTSDIEVNANGFVGADGVGDADLGGLRAFQLSTGSGTTVPFWKMGRCAAGERP